MADSGWIYSGSSREHRIRIRVWTGTEDAGNNRTYCYAQSILESYGSTSFNARSNNHFGIDGSTNNVVNDNSVYYSTVGVSEIQLGWWEGWVGHDVNGSRYFSAHSDFDVLGGGQVWDVDYIAADAGTWLPDYDRRPWTPSVQSASRDRGSITMYLNDPGARNSGPARQYWQYRYSTGNTDPWYEASYTASTTQSFSGTPTQTYYFQFRAYNSDGWGDWGNNWGIHGSPSTPSIPGATRSTTTSGAIDVSWSAPSSNLTIDQYAVDRYSADGQTYITRIYSGGTALSKQDTGLTRGDRYTYRVYAHNSSGWSDISGFQATSIMVPGIPGIPAAPTVTSKIGRTLTINSARGSNDYGNTIIEYRIQLSTDNGVTWKGWNNTTKSFITTGNNWNVLDSSGNFVYSLLTPALTYKWRVYAVNSIGTGDIATMSSGTFVGAGGKRFDGSSFQPTSTSKRYDGNNWVDFTTAKRYDGNSWVDLT